MGKTAEKPQAIDFEAAMAELNQLVEQMEQGGTTLETALQSFERGVVLVRQCQQALQTAEQKVQILLEQNAQSLLAPFASKDTDV